MAELLVKKKRAIELIDEKIDRCKNLIIEIENIGNTNQYDKVLDKHDVWWKSVGELLIQIFDDERISKSFKNHNGFFFTEISFSQKVNDFKNETENDLNKLIQIKTDIKNEIYKTNSNTTTTYDNIINSLKNNKIIAIILVVIVVLLGGLKIFNESSKAKDNFTKINQTENDEIDQPDKSIVSDNQIIIDTLANSELQYLKNITILDKGLYIRYNYNDLHLGGANLDSIKLNGRTADGIPLNFRKNDGFIQTSITQLPYIEIEYKGANYSIEIIGKQYDLKYLILKNINQTLSLKSVEEY